MTQYLLTIYQPDGPALAGDAMDSVARDLHELNAELQAAGAWVFTGGLHAPSTATVVRVRDSDVVVTDGPFVEGKEHVGGIWVIDAPDLDAALEWGRKAAKATTLPIEVRPFQDRAAF
jgi:hypothetical protein